MPQDTRGPEPIGEMSDDGHSWSKTIWIPKISESEIELLPDEQGLTKELAVEKRAIDDGERQLPPETDTSLNQTQMQICSSIFKGILLLNEFLGDQLARAVQAARAQRVEVRSPERVKQQMSKAVDEVFADHEAELRALRIEEMRHGRSLRAFALRHGLHRQAHYKPSLEIPVAIIVGMLALESALNGTLLGGVLPGGLVEGAALATLISAINIALGLVAGLYGWRLIHHRNTANRVIGASITGICHLIAVAWNLLVAHFREAAESLSSSAAFDGDLATLSRATMDHLSSAGLFGLASVQAWALLLLGILIHFLAAREGWEDLADRYLDYKPHDLRARRAEDAFAGAMEVLREDARGAVEDMEADGDRAVEQADQALRNIKDLRELAEQRRQEVLNSEDDWVITGNRLLKLYRDRNTQVRDEGTAPAYFSVYPNADAYRARDFGAALKPSHEIEKQEAAVRRNMDALAELEADARERLRLAEEAAAELHRHAAALIRDLASRLAKTERRMTRLALETLDGGGKAPGPLAQEEPHEALA